MGHVRPHVWSASCLTTTYRSLARCSGHSSYSEPNNALHAHPMHHSALHRQASVSHHPHLIKVLRCCC